MAGLGASFLLALGLFLLIEGLLPLIAPDRWRAYVERIASFSNGQLRFIGLLAVLVGLGLVALSDLK